MTEHAKAQDELLKVKPWLSYVANNWLEENAQQTWKVLEFGSGGSTLWLGQHCESVVSAEHDREWYDKVCQYKTENTDLRLHSRPCPQEVFDSLPDNHFDLVIIDGRDRVHCAQKVYQKCKPGGHFLLDDGQRRYYQQIIDDLQKMKWKELFTFPPGGHGDPRRWTRIWQCLSS